MTSGLGTQGIEAPVAAVLRQPAPLVIDLRRNENLLA